MQRPYVTHLRHRRARTSAYPGCVCGWYGQDLRRGGGSDPGAASAALQRERLGSIPLAQLKAAVDRTGQAKLCCRQHPGPIAFVRRWFATPTPCRRGSPSRREFIRASPVVGCKPWFLDLRSGRRPGSLWRAANRSPWWLSDLRSGAGLGRSPQLSAMTHDLAWWPARQAARDSRALPARTAVWQLNIMHLLGSRPLKST